MIPKIKQILGEPTTWIQTSINWQTCPLCDGTGIKSTPGLSTGLPPCEVCGGKRIIHLITGKPPKD